MLKLEILSKAHKDKLMVVLVLSSKEIKQARVIVNKKAPLWWEQ